jgi:nitroreductase
MPAFPGNRAQPNQRKTEMISTDTILTVTQAAERRRSIRAFKQEPIPREDLERILDVVRLAPSAFNIQPWRFIAVETLELKEKLAVAAYNQRQVTSAPTVLVLYTDMADALNRVDELIHPNMDAAATRQSILGYFGPQSSDEQESWAAAQGNIALGYLLLAVESHGYQSSPMAGFDPEQVKKILQLPSHVRVPALIAIGKGTEEGFEHHRHSVNRISRFV